MVASLFLFVIPGYSPDSLLLSVGAALFYTSLNTDTIAINTCASVDKQTIAFRPVCSNRAPDIKAPHPIAIIPVSQAPCRYEVVPSTAKYS